MAHEPRSPEPGEPNPPSALRVEIDELTRLAWEVRRSDPERAAELCERAAGLARSGEYTLHPYVPGLAASLAVQAFLGYGGGKLDLAASKSLEALALLEGHPHSEAGVSATMTLAWTHLHGANVPRALELAMRALDQARSLGLPFWEAGLQDTLGNAYTLAGDHTQAASRYQEALRIAREQGLIDGEAATLNNLTDLLVMQGNHEVALEMALRCLEHSRRHSLTHREIVAAVRVADVLVEMGQPARAQPYLDEALRLPNATRRGVASFYLLEGLGRVHLELGQWAQAEERCREALALAVEANALPSQSNCHLRLSELHERKGDFARALEHHKLYHSLTEAVSGEKVAKQVALLKVMHQLESAERDAHAYRLRTVALQEEIDRRDEVESLLKEQASLDALTGLYNRRHLMELGHRELERAIRFDHPLCLLLIDVDHFKQFNDRYGHAVGDQVLASAAAVIRSSLREIDLVGRWGGEEFAVILPETALSGGIGVGESLRKAVAAHSVTSDGGALAITVSVGAAGLESIDGHGSAALAELFNQADQALYAAKRGGRDRVEAFGR